MRVMTRGDLDGLASLVLLSLVEDIGEIVFAHPKDVQDGLVPAGPEDIVVNLPFVKGCGMWFDHHISEDEKQAEIGPFKGAFAVAPSTARVIHDHYKSPAFAAYRTMLEETDRLDAAQLTMADVTAPKDWILLGLTLDPRSGFGPEFQKYFRWLVEYVKELPIEKVLEHAEVKKRCTRVVSEQEAFKTVLKQHARLDGTVILTDLRGVDMRSQPVGNRFLVFTVFPKGTVEVRIFKGKQGNTVMAVGHSIFNRTCTVNVGELMAKYGGGGHRGAGTCQVEAARAETVLAEIIRTLKH
jgi:hypothetical protein